MSHKLFIISLREVISGMASATLMALESSLDGLRGVGEEVPRLKRLNQVTVPDEALVANTKLISERSFDLLHPFVSIG